MTTRRFTKMYIIVGILFAATVAVKCSSLQGDRYTAITAGDTSLSLVTVQIGTAKHGGQSAQSAQTLNITAVEAMSSGAQERTATTVNGTYDKAVCVADAVMVFRENTSSILQYFPLQACSTPEIAAAHGGINPSVINVKCDCNIYGLFKYLDSDEYGTELILILPNPESPTAFVRHNGRSSIALVQSQVIWLRTDINGRYTPGWEFVTSLHQVNCNNLQSMSTYTDDAVLVKCSNGYIVVNIDGSHHIPPSLPSDVTNVHTHSSGLAVVTTPGTYTVYRDTMTSNCSPVPTSTTLLAVDFATTSSGDVLIILLFSDRIETINATMQCSDADVVARFGNQSVSLSQGRQLYDIHDGSIGVVTISRGLYNVTYYNLTTHCVIFYRTSFERPVVFTIVKQVNANADPSTSITSTSVDTRPTATVTPTTRYATTTTLITSSPTTYVTSSPTISSTSSNSTAVAPQATSTTVTPIGSISAPTSTVMATVNAVAIAKGKRWWHAQWYIPIVAVILILVVVAIGLPCTLWHVKKRKSRCCTHMASLKICGTLANCNGKGPYCNPTPDPPSVSTDTSPHGTPPSIHSGFTIADGIPANSVQIDELVVVGARPS